VITVDPDREIVYLTKLGTEKDDIGFKKGGPSLRVLSGIQPSGSLHLGNYLGMMKPMVEYMDRSTLFVFIVNLHALTSVTDGEKLAKGTLDAAADFLALGLDPDRCIFWVQSDVPEVIELTWILTCITPMGLLERCHSYKDKIARGISPNHGLFSYPVLMAADILLYQSNIIPVGKDQKQHVEVARDIALKFNNMYGETFVIPEPEINDEVATVPGIDGQKMSKSYDNTIEIFLDEMTLKKKVMSIKTDSTPVEEAKNPDTCNLFQIYRHFAPLDRAEEVLRLYKEGGAAYGTIKKELVGILWDFFREAREERTRLLKDPGHLRDILAKGAMKAREIGQGTIDTVRKRVGIVY
jgi:tryptophanyl-tRNA synthetase